MQNDQVTEPDDPDLRPPLKPPSPHLQGEQWNMGHLLFSGHCWGTFTS